MGPFTIGDLVWVKMKGYCAWPGVIVERPTNFELVWKRPIAKDSLCVFFFGTNDYGMARPNQIRKYQDEDMSRAKPRLKNAIEAIKNYIRAGCRGDYDPNRVRQCKPKKTTLLSKPRRVARHRQRLSVVDPVIPRRGRRRKQPDSEEATGPLLLATRANSSSDISPEPEPLPAECHVLRQTRIVQSTVKFGFLGLGGMGEGIVKNLINSNHSVVVWNRTSKKCVQFGLLGAEVAMTPEETVHMADITFSCLSDTNAVKNVLLGDHGAINAIRAGKAYIELTTIDYTTSIENEKLIKSRGGRYLEIQMQGNREMAEDGTLTILVSGDKTLCCECRPTLEAFASYVEYIGPTGDASRMNSGIQIVKGIGLTTLAETISIADDASIEDCNILDLLELSPIRCTYISQKIRAMLNNDFSTVLSPLKFMQNDLHMALMLGTEYGVPLPLTAAANEAFKEAIRLGFAELDDSAVFIRKNNRR